MLVRRGWEHLPTDLPFIIVKILMVDWDGHGSLFQRSLCLHQVGRVWVSKKALP
jgi:hypothetical protein